MGRSFLSIQLAFAFGLLISVLVVASTGLQDGPQARDTAVRPVGGDVREAGRSRQHRGTRTSCAHSRDGLLIAEEIVVSMDVLDSLVGEPVRPRGQPLVWRRAAQAAAMTAAAARAEAACPPQRLKPQART